MRDRLKSAAIAIAAKYGKPPSNPVKAIRKLFISERWIGTGIRASGLRAWKRGELFEVVEAILNRDIASVREEWGDCGYYCAQSFDLVWWLYVSITPSEIVEQAVRKFERRAS